MTAPAETRLFLDVDSRQRSKYGQLACGDRIASSRSPDGKTVVVVLSDGLGSGIKANILSTMTAVMALKFSESGQEFPKAAETMMRVLPICSVRRISYATFSIAVWSAGRTLKVVEMGNPEMIYLREGKELEVPTKVYSSKEWENRCIRVSEIYPKEEDRVVLMSDGISQSGMGTEQHPLGFRRSGCAEYCRELLVEKPGISAREMSFSIVDKALSAETNRQPSDDMSCITLHFRQPRSLEVVTGPPFHEDQDKNWARKVDSFQGTKVICGGTTSKILERELTRKLSVRMLRGRGRQSFPPAADMEGFALVTEGIITLTRTAQILEEREAPLPEDPASRLASLLRDHDSITFMVGTKVNEAHQDPALPADIELRRAVIKRLDAVLREKYLKETNIIYT